MKNIKLLSAQKPVNPAILQLEEPLSFRKKLVRENAGYTAMIKERKHMYEVNDRDFMIASLLKKLKVNEKMIEKTEATIATLVVGDPSCIQVLFS